jgi:hypothetical protein
MYPNIIKIIATEIGQTSFSYNDTTRRRKHLLV